jgi:hypothetical protein
MEGNKVLYITTFNKKLYDQSGLDLINSFLTTETNGELLVCYEEINFIHDDIKILSYDMTNDEYMLQWINTNINNIPECYGGNAKNTHPIVIQFNKQEGQYWANHRASRYFRKVVALNYALEHYSNKYDFIFVIDSDCIFKKRVDDSVVDSIFSDKSAMIYYWSTYRKKIDRGPETGFTGYCKKNNGFEFAKIICKCFASQDFLRFKYWDDGYVIGQLINENYDKFKLKDLVKDSKAITTRVMEIKENILFDYIHHFKNKHQMSV